MKYKVVVGTLFIAGQKYKRGDVVDLADASLYGTRLEPMPEAPVVEKPKRKTKAKKAAE
jgi:hypothetical protein